MIRIFLDNLWSNF